MKFDRLSATSLSLVLLLGEWSTAFAEDLRVSTDFEGASAVVLEVDQAARSILFTPGGDPARGWPCWWYFRVDGAAAGETVEFRLRGSSATIEQDNGRLQKPLSPQWAMPDRATFSADAQTWEHTQPGSRLADSITYRVQSLGSPIFLAWGPPYTPGFATRMVRELAERGGGAEALTLCESRGGIPVPMLHVKEGAVPKSRRFGVWVQARQHAWETGSSWVAQGFAEWLQSEPGLWLRQNAEVFVVPIMDVDNTATGNGGKDALPHDHNRDWSDVPHWNETVAAQHKVKELTAQGRMHVFLDLHNPAAGDPTFFFLLSAEYLTPEMLSKRERFVELTYAKVGEARPRIPMSSKPKFTGPAYHPRWREISANWVAMNGNSHTVSTCLETIWNSPVSNVSGYRAVGGCLAEAVAEFLREQPALAPAQR